MNRGEIDEVEAAPDKELENDADKKAAEPDSADEPESADELAPYHKFARPPGTGPSRIDTTLVLNDDIYSQYFVSTMHSDYIYYHTEFAVAGDEKNDAELPSEIFVENDVEYVTKHAEKMQKRKFRLKKDMLNMMT